MQPRIRVTVWGENVHEHTNPVVHAHYPKGMHHCIGGALARCKDFDVRTVTLQQREHGLSKDVLDTTDVLTWWGHKAHARVANTVVERVAARVWEGMGLIALHSAHFSKLFKRLMGTTCSLKWREAGEKERVWVCQPGHPIAAGLEPYFELPESEMYGEPFGIPIPDEQIFISWFAGGEVFRSGCTWRRGAGKIFYFGPGHETYPIYHDPNVQLVLRNAVYWAAPRGDRWVDRCAKMPPVEELERS